MLGSINCFIPSFVIFNGNKVLYNGTTLDKVKSLINAGAKLNDTFIQDDKKLKIISTIDNRTNNLWATEWNEKY
jgi:hypothetical protein